ncbi:hypothetical protein [Vibrio coralliilyticus]|uniref:hypothetical protein n=1 Tax=Vibrio coralliilyticus TaxID=190893 RepID=UPI002FD2C607
MNEFINFLLGSAGGGAIVWLTRNWISERLKQSISYEYSEKLAEHKVSLNKKVLEIQHGNEVMQLRTSLFFDHQREAFTEILTKIYEIKEDWYEDFDPGAGLEKPVSGQLYDELKALIAKHQIFLDDESLFIVDLLLSAYSKSFPYSDGISEEYEGDVIGAYRDVSFLTPHLQSHFRSKIGVSTDQNGLIDCSYFYVIKVINDYNLPDIGLPVKGLFEINMYNSLPADWVRIARENNTALCSKLDELDKYLSQKGFYHDVSSKVKLCRRVIGME